MVDRAAVAPAFFVTASGGLRGMAHDRLTIALICVLALSPLPFGSNRPFFWALWAAAIGAIAAVFMLNTGRGRRQLRVAFSDVPLTSALWLIYCGYIVLQCLPLGKFLGPFQFRSDAGFVLTSQSLSLTPDASMLAFLRAVTYGLLYFLVLQVTVNPDRRARLVRFVLFVLSAYALYGLLALTQFGDTILIFDKWAYLGSATGPFVNRNSFATYLAIGVVIAVCLLVSEANRAERRGRHTSFWQVPSSDLALFSLCLALLLATLLATQSRMGLFAAGGGVLTVLILAMRHAAAKRWISALAALLVVLGALLVWAYGSGFVGRLSEAVQAAESRAELYSQVANMLAARPWLGYGGDSFEVAFPLFHRAPFGIELVWHRSHSTYLAFWTEYGFIVGSIPLLILLLIARKVLLALRSDRERRPEATIALGALVVVAVHSTIDFSLEIEANALLFVFLLGLGAGPAFGQKERRHGAAGRNRSSVSQPPE